jgi:hypothetical protein
MDRLDQRQQWTLLAGAASAAAAPLAERALVAAWRAITDEDPPEDPAGPDVDWGRALAWTAASAVVVALVQVAARRGAALAWHHYTGERPPAPRRRHRKLVKSRR